jgi:hypothetical protein
MFFGIDKPVESRTLLGGFATVRRLPEDDD